MPLPAKQSLPIPHDPYPLATTNLFSISMDLLILDIALNGQLHFSFMLPVGADRLFCGSQRLDTWPRL